jgi:hypothetical protein
MPDRTHAPRASRGRIDDRDEPRRKRCPTCGVAQPSFAFPSER